MYNFCILKSTYIFFDDNKIKYPYGTHENRGYRQLKKNIHIYSTQKLVLMLCIKIMIKN